ncbi:hypothetical protein THAOC_21085 [Thalassiosira oceanica]|uniref:Uncharacterized protein n=1 Tax=Thalassiosira oceanica TaxID=159749 RepID=K0RYC5_THAOC|nr:hypothetical protein THAOC_21085 [Thalassiosira oceanica]|eukprot:EJK58758.1 hypothetical protein THAOC_21085 [Thalassiosira oceanica]
MDDGQSDAKRRRVRAPDPRGGVTTRTLDDIHSVLEEHARQIEKLTAANKQLEVRNTALEERCKALDRKSESLERASDELEVRCSSLERSIQVLRKDVDWTYSAPDVPRSHWIEQGHDEEYTDNMEGCLRRIKRDVERIRNGEEDYYCACLDYEDQLSILHDNALLPHFKELADAIQLSNDIQQINIDNMELRPSALNILFPVMEGKVTGIFMRARFPDPDAVECYETISASIRRNHALKKLTWIGNQIPSDDQADLLIKSIIDNWAIKDVVLNNCFNQSDNNGCKALASLISSGGPVSCLDFRENGLSDIDDVAAALATNPQLETLWISDNDLNDRDAELIAEALKQNTNLQVLYLYDNSITSAGFEKIAEAIYDPSSLTAMESCNHTCWVDCVERNDHYRGGNFKGMASQQRRRRKLYKLLSARHAEGSNARHLNAELGEGAFTTKLVPRVLRCIGRWSADRDKPAPLSLCFELMKSWNMPELYEHRDIV